MKPATLALNVVSILAVAGLFASRAAAASLQDAIGLYPQSFLFVSEHFDTRSAGQGHISETGTYQTDDAVLAVLNQYLGRYQPVPGQHRPFHCVVLGRSNRYAFVRLTVNVMLCPSRSGTQIAVDRHLYLWPAP